MEKILPMQEPFTKTFPKDANAVALMLNYKKAYPWLMNCFIQLTCWGNQFLDYYDFYYRNCPLIECQRIKKELIGSTKSEIIDFITSAIDKEYYVFLPIMTKYIHVYDFDSVHDILIYGYSDSKKFYIADNFSKGMYKKKECTIEELIESIQEFPISEYWYNGYRGTVELLSYIPEERAIFELYRVVESIHDYLNSSPTKNWFVNYAMWNASEIKNRCFGIQCYNCILLHLENAKKGMLDSSGIRAFYMEWEHKNIMCLRLIWMKEKYRIEQKIIDVYKEIEQKTQKALRMILKFELKNDIKILERISEIYQSVIKEEKSILEELLRNLSKQ